MMRFTPARVFLIVIAAISFCGQSNPSKAAGDCDSLRLISLASRRLDSLCLHSHASLKGDPDSAESAPAMSLQVKACHRIVVEKRSFLCAILGCVGYGELVAVVDDPKSKILRTSINIPGAHASFADPVDMDGDGKAEIPIYESGSKGEWIIVVQLEGDSLRLAPDTAGRTQFYASNGIEIRDIDGDGKPEIVLVQYDSHGSTREILKLKRGILQRVPESAPDGKVR